MSGQKKAQKSIQPTVFFSCNDGLRFSYFTELHSHDSTSIITNDILVFDNIN